MAYVVSVATTTVSSSSVAIMASGTEKIAVEVTAMDAPVWVHVTGGTASASGAGCRPVPQNESRRFDLPGSHNGLTAIRDGATDAEVAVAVLGG